jgi:hypothetical protein
MMRPTVLGSRQKISMALPSTVEIYFRNRNLWIFEVVMMGLGLCVKVKIPRDFFNLLIVHLFHLHRDFEIARGLARW